MSTKREIRAAAAALGRKGGKVKSEAKAEAARKNGRRGGRPRVAHLSPETDSRANGRKSAENEGL